MNKIAINESIGLFLFLPDGYEKVKLPGKDEWVKALTSGKYKQGAGQLCNYDCGNPRYCCLGVLSDIQGRLMNGSDGQFYLSEDNPNFYILRNKGIFPAQIQTAMGISRQNDIAELNDSGVSFEDIAKVIDLVWA